MFALVVDGEFLGKVEAVQVVQALRASRNENTKVEVASFHPEMREWLPVCLERFAA